MKVFSDTHPSSIFKYCPKCGHTGFTFNGEKLFVCGACNLNYYLNPAPAVSGIIEVPDGRILLARRKLNPRIGTLDLPGGFIDILERAEDALIREIDEELGIKISNFTFFATFPNEYVYKNVCYFTCDIAFVCKLDTIPDFCPADDVSEAILIQPKDINFEELSFISTSNIMKKYIASK